MPIDPAAVRADLAARAGHPGKVDATEAAPDRSGTLAPRSVAAAIDAAPAARATVPAAPSDRDAILAGISASYFRLRRGLALITLAFPVVLWLGSGAHPLQGSLSAYYHYAFGRVGDGDGTMRDVFVGVLWTIGSFLFFYRGYSAAEDRALNLAGAAAVVISLSPMDWPAGSAVSLHGRVHGGAAIVFFLCIAYVAIVRSRDTLVLLPAATARRFAWTYRLLGTLMIAAPLTVAAIHFVAPRPNSVVVWAIEVAGTYVFAAFWLVKSREIARIATP